MGVGKSARANHALRPFRAQALSCESQRKASARVAQAFDTTVDNVISDISSKNTTIAMKYDDFQYADYIFQIIM